MSDYENVATYYEIEDCWKPSGNSNPVTGAKSIIELANGMFMDYGLNKLAEWRRKPKYSEELWKKV